MKRRYRTDQAWVRDKPNPQHAPPSPMPSFAPIPADAFHRIRPPHLCHKAERIITVHTKRAGDSRHCPASTDLPLGLSHLCYKKSEKVSRFSARFLSEWY